MIQDKIIEIRECGFCVLKEHFAPRLIDACRNALWPVLLAYLETHGHEPNRGRHRHFLPMPFKPPCFAPEFFFDQDVLSILRGLMDDRLVADQWHCDVALPGSDYQGIHVDYQRPLFEEAPDLTLPAYVLVVSFGLLPISLENGPIEIAPGTHRLPRQEALRAVEAGEIGIQPVPLEIGDVLIRHPWALHRGSPNTAEVSRALVSSATCAAGIRTTAAKSIQFRAGFGSRRRPNNSPCCDFQSRIDSSACDNLNMRKILAALFCCGLAWTQASTDWPNLARYHDDNARLAPAAAGENRVVFMGDSITDGWGRQYGQFFPGKPYVNRGISGQTTPQMLIRFRPDVIALQPKVVVFLAGTNDIAGNTGPMTLEAIEDNLTSMAELARANNIRVVLCSVLPVCDYIKPQTARRPPDKIVALNAWIKNYAAKNGFVYLDYYSATIDDKQMFRKEFTYDGLHPNAAGYEVMAPLAEKAIAAALAN